MKVSQEPFIKAGVIEGSCKFPYIHSFSWYEARLYRKAPVHLENDADCVGLSE